MSLPICLRSLRTPVLILVTTASTTVFKVTELTGRISRIMKSLTLIEKQVNWVGIWFFLLH